MKKPNSNWIAHTLGPEICKNGKCVFESFVNEHLNSVRGMFDYSLVNKLVSKDCVLLHSFAFFFATTVRNWSPVVSGLFAFVG